MSEDRSRTWTLHRKQDGVPLADLVVTEGDFPWLYAQVRAHDGLPGVMPLFTEELRLLADDQDVPSWEAAYDAVRDAVTLRDPDGQEVPEFLLHIKGDEAWWRWSDEPFDEDP